MRDPYASVPQRFQAFDFCRETRGLAGLGEMPCTQTPESRMFAMDSRSTRISMNARSNLNWQVSEA